MKIKKLIEKLNLTVFNGGLDKEIEKFYIGDLLSRVMGKAETNCGWLTIMSNVNVAAVARLVECGCVILCEKVQPDESLREKMESINIYLLGTDLSAFELAKKIVESVNE